MLRSAVRLLRFIALLSVATGPALADSPSESARVLLTFDVEKPGDAEALEAMGLSVRASYFFTGDYGRSHPELVRRLARAGNTIGSHSYFHDDLTTLGPRQRELDLQMSRVALQALACVPVRWFRPPYLEYDDATMRQAAEAGLLFSSADKEPWPRNSALPELPVAVHQGMLVSDWDIFESARQDSDEALRFLEEAFEAHRLSGRPFVVLLHPRIIGVRPEVLHDFIAHAEEAGARFLTLDDFVAETRLPGPDRIGLWLDRNPRGPEAVRVASEVARLGVTDLVVPLLPAEAAPPGLSAEGSQVDPALLELRARGVRLLGALSLLRAPELLVRRPDLAMEDAAGNRSRLWVSPSHSEARSHAVAGVRAHSLDPGLDGLLLTDIRYPDVRLDHSPAAFAGFSAASGQSIQSASDIWKNYAQWSHWRTGELADLLREAYEAAREERGSGFLVGGAFPAAAALDYRAVELTGQQLTELAPALDFAVMVVPSEGAARDSGILDRTWFGAEARNGGTETLLAVTPPLSFSEGAEPPLPFQATIMFGAGDGPLASEAPRHLARSLLPDRPNPALSRPWLRVSESCGSDSGEQ